VILFYTCNRQHNKADYLPLIKELHEIECEQLIKAGVSTFISDTTIYAFRSRAFDKIMTNKPDAKLIAHYEELNQKLASMEYYMDGFEKKIYQNDFAEIYLKKCQ
jgi:hypothetical protein